MIFARLFHRQPTPSEAARILSDHRRLSQRERQKAVARDMRRDRGLPPLAALEPRS